MKSVAHCVVECSAAFALALDAECLTYPLLCGLCVHVPRPQSPGLEKLSSATSLVSQSSVKSVRFSPAVEIAAD